MALRTVIEGVPVRIQTRTRWLALIGKGGITFGSWIFLRRPGVLVTTPWIAHEFAHVLQWKRLGVFRFVWQYATGLVRHGYGRSHPLEAEAIAYTEAHAGAPVFASVVRLLGGRA